ncbi:MULTISPECIES: hypothetical protein [Cyanophyceae]|uniref:hypothetical protein n=1 Tax=Cyanophyceae TaxID=3028117 RepID=UPI001689741E|nr:hypothetical protein [Trichocoleus sp. FACHB-40]MBD2003842.1 hypothetical protein [Trichocoleus sp. FACHB-40]
MNNVNDNQEFPSPQTDQEESENSSLIEELTKLIKQDKEKGRTAWKIGRNLFYLKKQRLEEFEKTHLPDSYSVKLLEAMFSLEFEIFISDTIGLSKAQTDIRLEIFKWIKNPNLISKRMGISHLEQVIRLKDEKAIEKLLNELLKIENKNKENNIPYTERIIASVVSKHQRHLQNQSNNKNLSLFSDDNSESNENQKSTEIDFDFIDSLKTEILDYESQSEQKKSARADIWGQDIQTSCFPEIEDIYSKKPIDEQGLVGLFCTIFPIIKSKKLTIKDSDFLGFCEIPLKYQLYFLKIKGIRTRFPDAIIDFAICNQDLTIYATTEISVEFEFESFNYTRHRHYETHEKCPLIVCWKHEELSKWKNWKQIYYKKDKPLPFILSVEKLLETGEINLINLNEP